MAEINVTKRSWTLDVDGTYVLATAIPDSDRPQTLVIRGVRSSYDGAITPKYRPRGSAGGTWTAIAYEIIGTGATATAVLGTAAGFDIQIDSTGKEIALDATGRTAGSIALEITDSVEQ